MLANHFLSILSLKTCPRKKPTKPIGAKMIKTLTNTRDIFAPITIKAISIGKTPRNIGIEMKAKINIRVNRREDSQHINACSNSSSNIEACTDMINNRRNKIGPRFLRMIKNPSWPWTSANPMVTRMDRSLFSNYSLPLILSRFRTRLIKVISF